ncbi:MAG: COG1470 family protein [Bacteroidales bacterium]
MSVHIKGSLFFVVLLTCSSFTSFADVSDSLKLYTPFPRVTVTPGESLDYTITVINNSSEIKTVNISVTGIPKNWNYSMKSGTWNLRQISVMPKDKQLVSLRMNIPYNVNKGTYRFDFIASGYDKLPLEIIVTEQGSFQTEFTTEQNNLQGNPTSSFTFNATLRNRTPEKQLYAFSSYAPRGWSVIFRANYQAVTSVNVEPNSNQSITIEVKPPERVEAGKYKIPVTASTGNNSATLELEVDITGTYGIELSTSTGLLSTEITAGEEKRVDLIVKNTGTAELTGISLNYSGPVNWTCDFEPKKIDKLPANETAEVIAKIKADKKAITGDYVAHIDATTPEATSKITYRITVKTPLLWGWVGILIIVVAIGSVYYLFRKYGRR